MHDEALTLATAFLAAGACSVIGSRWLAVNDSRTMAMMYMFHHYLNGRGGSEAAGSPADALRAAQLWMLDPHRVFPAAVEDVLGDRDKAALDDPEVWAVLTHQGA
jgi:CHAT domain-containing protein